MEDGPGDRAHRPAWSGLRVGSPKLVAGLALIVAVFAAHLGLMVAQSSSLIDGTRYFCLIDDAMISMTYARNWAHGDGIVWNVGEVPVEGYTNFAWMAVMAAVHAAGFSELTAPLVMQMLGVVLACLYVVGAFAVGRALSGSDGAVLLGCSLTAAYGSLQILSVGGMENGLLAVLVSFALASALRCLRGGRLSASPFALLALACVVRTDMVLLLAALAVTLAVVRRDVWSRLLGLALLALLPMFVHLLWRHAYYGEWLPNTYYLKVFAWPLEHRVARGVGWTLQGGVRIALPLLVVVVGFLRLRDPGRLLVLAGAGLLLAYEAWVGGDFMRVDRFVTPMVPALLACAAVDLCREAGALHERGALRRGGRVVVILVVAVAMALLLNRGQWQGLVVDRSEVLQVGTSKILRRALAIDRATDSRAVVGVFYAGTAPYFVPRTYVDFFGKSDPRIARTPVQPVALDGTPGHNKWDWDYAIGMRKPDVVAKESNGLRLHGEFQREYRKYRVRGNLDEDATFWVRLGSPRIRWSEIEPAGEG